jgi:rhodanese-related sulfurtransferase
MTATISPQELARRKSADEAVRLIDVRTPVEFREVHVDFAENILLSELRPESLRSDNSDAQVYVICRSGSRGRQACERLQSAGLRAVNIEGGTSAWEAAGLPVSRSGAKAISLERQVRIAAGVLVLTGVLFGWLVHPGFYGLAGFVGVGLLFAGVTDWCGMGLLLARMPWNQVADATQKPACSVNN